MLNKTEVNMTIIRKKITFPFLISLLLLCSFSADTFKDDQLRYKRVRAAYKNKESAMTKLLSVWSETDNFYSRLLSGWEIFCFSFFRRCATKRCAELADASLSKCGILSLSKCSISRQEKKRNRLKRIYFNIVVFPTRHYLTRKDYLLKSSNSTCGHLK